MSFSHHAVLVTDKLAILKPLFDDNLKNVPSPFKRI